MVDIFIYKYFFLGNAEFTEKTNAGKQKILQVDGGQTSRKFKALTFYKEEH
jgi:hypothetical protein